MDIIFPLRSKNNSLAESPMKPDSRGVESLARLCRRVIQAQVQHLGKKSQVWNLPLKPSMEPEKGSYQDDSPS